jgi:hypothetical protein
VSPVVEDVDTLLPKESSTLVREMLFKVAGLMNTVPTPIAVTVVPDPIIPVSTFRVCPTSILVVVIPVTDVVVIPISPSDAVATPTKVVVVVVSVVVPIPLKIWSALESIIATLIPFAQEPGFLAATVTPVMVFSSYPSSS